MKSSSLLRIKKLVLIALITAVLSAGKFALAAIPNVEIVTICIIACSYVFGLGIVLPATLIFCVIELSVWGFAPWSISYFIYWPLLAFGAFFMRRLFDKNKVIFPAITAMIMSLFFGVITTLVDTLFYAQGNGFLEFFAAMYIRGLYFFLIHIVSNTIILAILFHPFSKVLVMLRDKYYGFNVGKKEVIKKKDKDCESLNDENIVE